MSPGLMPRPSLSGSILPRTRSQGARVAGVDAPAFVERPTPTPRPGAARRVAGVDAPAFVERAPTMRRMRMQTATCRRG